MAVVLGGRVREVANIKSAIRDSGEIEGTFSEDEVRTLSKMLRTGALPASLNYLEDRTVGASLGADSIKQGITAAIVGVLVVMVFMLVYYRGSGINADLALILNLVILLGFMGFTRATLTLPGIAGVILTIGMGVDSNVLIFERIREEVRAGKAASAAVDQGFAHAWVTIVDTHVTTIVSAAILFLFGTGPVKGFAVTLTFGLLANLFTAVFVSRVIFDTHVNKLKAGRTGFDLEAWHQGIKDAAKISIATPEPSAGTGSQEGRESVELFRSVNMDWLGKKWYFLGFSLIFSVAGIISMASHWTHHRQPGSARRRFPRWHQVQVQFNQPPDPEPDSPGHGGRGHQGCHDPQLWRRPARNEVLISLPEQHNETALDTGRQQIVNALQAHYATIPLTVRQRAGGGSDGGQASWRSRPAWRPCIRCSGCWFICGSVSS